jgi:hypothetical protein
VFYAFEEENGRFWEFEVMKIEGFQKGAEILKMAGK